MHAERTYLDHNASAPLRQAARDAMLAALEAPGNASSVHREGRAARALVDAARAAVAGLVGADARDVTFTSGATEAANLVLTPGLRDGGAPFEFLLAAAGEHPCVLAGHRFPADRIRIVPLTTRGVVDSAALETLLTQTPGRCLVALQAANNETGVIQPVRFVADMVHAKGGALVCDAVQAAGRTECRLAELKADALLLSAHKLGGPKGAGALVFGDGRFHIEGALIRGGGQERGARAGTENVAAVAGFAAAAREAFAEAATEAARLSGLRDAMESELTGEFSDLVVFEYLVLCRAGLFGGDAIDCARHRGHRDFVGFSLFVGKGLGFACAGGDGNFGGHRARRAAGQPRLDDKRERGGAFLRNVPKDCKNHARPPGHARGAYTLSRRSLKPRR